MTDEAGEALQTRSETFPTGFGAAAESWRGEGGLGGCLRIIRSRSATDLGQRAAGGPQPFPECSLSIPQMVSATNKQQKRQEAEGSASPTLGREKQCQELAKAAEASRKTSSVL